jgi:putative DNA primase/helicase
MSIGYVPLEEAEAQEAKAACNLAKPLAYVNGQALTGDRVAAIAAPATPYVELINGASITPEPVSWIWPGWLARGKVHILAGAPGTGKTTIAVSLAATISAGGTFPDGSQCEPGNVCIWSGEDDPKDTLVPRLIASGADMRRVNFISALVENGKRRSFNPAKDIDPLRSAIEKAGGAASIVVDPVVSVVAGDSHNNGDVRRSLQPLVDIAASMGAALLGITRFSKGTSGREPVERLTGSLAFGALARFVFATVKKEAEGDEPSSRIFCRAKSNLGPDDGGFAYDLQQSNLPGYAGVSASRIKWLGPITGAAREILAEAEQQRDGGSGNDARDFLMKTLADGRKPARELEQAAKANSVGWRAND